VRVADDPAAAEGLRRGVVRILRICTAVRVSRSQQGLRGGRKKGKSGLGLLVKLPATSPFTRTLTVKAVSSAMSSPGSGDVMMLLTMFPWSGMSPITMPLHEPPTTCAPFVIVLPVQKLMKLASSVRLSAWAGSPPPSWPVVAEAACTLAGSRTSAALLLLLLLLLLSLSLSLLLLLLLSSCGRGAASAAETRRRMGRKRMVAVRVLG